MILRAVEIWSILGLYYSHIYYMNRNSIFVWIKCRYICLCTCKYPKACRNGDDERSEEINNQAAKFLLRSASSNRWLYNSLCKFTFILEMYIMHVVYYIRMNHQPTMTYPLSLSLFSRLDKSQRHLTYFIACIITITLIVKAGKVTFK